MATRHWHQELLTVSIDLEIIDAFFLQKKTQTFFHGGHFENNSYRRFLRHKWVYLLLNRFVSSQPSSCPLVRYLDAMTMITTLIRTHNRGTVPPMFPLGLLRFTSAVSTSVFIKQMSYLYTILGDQGKYLLQLQLNLSRAFIVKRLYQVLSTFSFFVWRIQIKLVCLLWHQLSMHWFWSSV